MGGHSLAAILILAFCSSAQSSSLRTFTLQRECSGFEAPLMNNIGYVLSGYDIYYGNPVPTSGNSLVDPGFRAQIFETEYNGETSADNRYCTPDGLSVLSCDGNCAFSFNTEIIKGTHSYYNKLTTGAKFDVNAFGGAFGASQDYDHIQKYTNNGMNMFTQSEISCCVYTSELFTFTPPKFHRNFLGGLSTLTDSYDPYIYRRFLKEFGTHYVNRATMGALYGEQSMISREDWTEMTVDGVDIGFYADMSGLESIPSINGSFTYDKNITDTFHKFTKEQMTYSRGAIPPADGQHLSWAANTFDEPHVLTVELEPIDSLPIAEYISGAVRANLRMALEGYCSELKEEGELESCEPPEPDLPGPKPRVWSTWSNDRKGDDYRPQVRQLCCLLNQSVRNHSYLLFLRNVLKGSMWKKWIGGLGILLA